MTRRQLTDEEIAKKYSRPPLKRGPKSGHLKRTRPLDGSSLQSGDHSEYDRATKVNEAHQCSAKGCHRGRFGMSRWCLGHRVARYNTGDPQGRTLKATDWRAFADPSYRFVRTQLRKGHPSVVAAVHWIDREITLAERLESGSASAGHVDEATSVYLAWLLRAYRSGTTSLDFVSRFVAAYLADDRGSDEPSPRFVSDAHFKLQTARLVLYAHRLHTLGKPQRHHLLAEQVAKHPEAFKVETTEDPRWGGTKTVYRPRTPSWRPTFTSRERCFERWNRALGVFAIRAAEAVRKQQHGR
jgi:hypothetical protein